MTLELNADGLPLWQGTPLCLPPKERAVLALLIRAQPDAVGKEAIIEQAWGGAAVSDDSLVRCISQLRRLLPDIRIEAVYGYGYRLLLPAPAVHARLLAAAKGPPDAVEAYLHAREIAQHRTPVAMARALELLRKVAATYPDYAPARIALASTIGSALSWGLGGALGVTVAQGFEQLDAAQRSGPGSPGLASARAWLCDMAWRFDEAEALFGQALASKPDDIETLQLLSWHRLVTGDAVGAVAVLRRSVELRPHAPTLRAMLARCLAYGGQIGAALRELDLVLEEQPHHAIGLSLRLGLLARGRPDPALIEPARRLAELADAPPYARAVLPYVLACCGEPAQARALIEAALAGEQASVASDLLHAPALQLLGEPARALALIERAYEARCGVLPMLLCSPATQELAAHPGLQRIRAGVFGARGARGA